MCVQPVARGNASPAANYLGDVIEGQTVTLTWYLSAPLSQDASFDVNTVDGTAIGGTDYTPYSGSVICPAGGTTCTATPPETITMIDDGNSDEHRRSD